MTIVLNYIINNSKTIINSAILSSIAVNKGFIYQYFVELNPVWLRINIFILLFMKFVIKVINGHDFDTALLKEVNDLLIIKKWTSETDRGQTQIYFKHLKMVAITRNRFSILLCFLTTHKQSRINNKNISLEPEMYVHWKVLTCS